MRKVGACALLLVGCGDGPAPQPVCPADDASADVRAFVVGHKHAIADSLSYESYEASYRRHLDAIVPCLASGRENLLVFPEGAGLVALAIGSRGDGARQEQETVPAFLEIAKAYDPAAQYFAAEHPELSLQRRVFLGISDVVWRATLRTFGGIARSHGVWVLTNTDVAVVEPTDDPELLAVMRDPDLPESEPVYAPVGTDVYNSALLFDPTGALAGRVDKVWLTDPEEQLLDLQNGDLATLSVLETPFARIAAPISRDAFYAPFMQRVEDLGADLIVQPEAFSGWAVDQEDDWLPDVFLSSAWHHTQKHAPFRYNLTPQLTGNFLDMIFDGQVNVAVKLAPEQALAGYIGQQPIGGWGAIGPWVEADDPSGELGARREALRAVGEQLAPGSGSARENGYVDSLLIADLHMHKAPVTVARDASLPESQPAPASDGTQRLAAVASDGLERVLLAWQGGDERVHYVLSDDGGASFGASAQAPSLDGAAQRRPSVCMHPDGRALLAWQEGKPGNERIVVAALEADASTLGDPEGLPQGGGAQWEPTCGFLDPADEVLLVWTDLSSGVPLLQFAARAWNGAAFGAVQPVDDSTVALPRLDASQLQPALSATGGHLVWLDYRERSWDVYYARYQAGAFEPVRIDGVSDTRERLHADPRVAADGDRVLCAFTDLHDRRGHSDVAWVASDDNGDSWSAHAVIPGGPEELGGVSAGGEAQSRFRPVPLFDARGSSVVFQDLAPGKSAIFAATLGADAERVDDTGAAAVSLSRPVAARVSDGTLIAWEDDRDGELAIYTTVMKP